MPTVHRAETEPELEATGTPEPRLRPTLVDESRLSKQIDLFPERPPAAVWAAVVVDFMSAAALIVLALVLVHKLGEPGPSARTLLASAGTALAAAWLFLRIGKALLDGQRLARATQLAVSGLTSVAAAAAVLQLSGHLDLVGQELSARVVMGGVLLHLLAMLALMAPTATEFFREEE